MGSLLVMKDLSSGTIKTENSSFPLNKLMVMNLLLKIHLQMVLLILWVLLWIMSLYRLVVAQVVFSIKTNMIWTLMLVKKSTITHVTKNVTIEMNGITHKDLTDVITNVI